MQHDEKEFLQQHAEMLSAIATKVLRAQMEIRDFIWKQETAQKWKAEKEEVLPHPVKRIP